MVIGFGTAICFLVAIFYSINSFDNVLNSGSTFPLTEIYFQATSSRGGALGLLLVIFGATIVTLIGTYIASGRMLWTLARDGATPLSNHLGRVSGTWGNPFRSTFACGVVCTVMGCIYVGSTTAFNAFVGSFVVLSTLSYLAALLYVDRLCPVSTCYRWEFQANAQQATLSYGARKHQTRTILVARTNRHGHPRH